MNLHGISDILSNNELKNVIGGCGGSGGSYFKCTCSNGGANPPYRNPWCTDYSTSEEMYKAIKKICMSGTATCVSGCF